MHENPFALGSSESYNPRCPSPSIKHQYSRRKNPFYSIADEQVFYQENGFSARRLAKQRFNMGGGALREPKHPYLNGTNPGFIVDYRDRDDALHGQAYRPDSRLPPYDNGPTISNHSLTSLQSREHSSLSNWRCLPQALPSPSTHSAALSMTENIDQIHQLPAPMSIAHPKPPPVPSGNYNNGAGSRRLDSPKALADTGTYMMTPLHSGVDRCYTGVALTKLPSDRPRQVYPPPVPPKSPLRKALLTRTIPDVSFSALPDLRFPTKG